MVNFTHKNKLGGKKRTNKRKVSSRKYKKRGGMFDGFKGIKVKIYDMSMPDPLGKDYILRRKESTTHLLDAESIKRISDNKRFSFWGYHPEKKLIHLKEDDKLLTAHGSYLKPEEFDGKFSTREENIFGKLVDKKIKFKDINNIETYDFSQGGGGKRKTLKKSKKSKKSKKVKKSRKNRK